MRIYTSTNFKIGFNKKFKILIIIATSAKSPPNGEAQFPFRFPEIIHLDETIPDSII